MVNFQYWGGELDIYHKDCYMEEKDQPILNICDTMGGLTVMVTPGYELSENKDMPGFFVVEKKR